MLETFQGKEFSVNELIVAAARVTPGYAGEQTRYRVTEQVDPRTLRYYIHQGLVDKPLRYEGRSGVYGYRHLLQLVAIKTLQSEYLPLRKVKEMMAGQDDDGLEDLIETAPRGGPPPPPAEADMLMMDDLGEAEEPPPAAPKARRKSKADLGSGLLKSIFQRSQRPLPPPEPEEPAGPETWTRHEIAPGLEVHVRDDFPVDPPQSSLKVWAVRFQKFLQSRKGDSK